AATNDGHLYVTRNGGTSWTPADSGLPKSASNYVVAIQVDPANPKHVFVATNGVGATTHVWETLTAGTAWGNRTGNLPATYAVNALLVDWRYASAPPLYVG